jgi:DNA-binding XRE family transcriptional regulator
MIMALLKKQEKEFAKSLYITGGITQKEIAARVSVTEKTLASWIKKEKWDSLKKSLLTTKQNQLSFLYDQLDFLNTDISTREYKVAAGKEADTIIKLTAAINRLETETSIGDTVEVARNFIEFVRQQDLELAKTITNLFDVFITAKMK